MPMPGRSYGNPHMDPIPDEAVPAAAMQSDQQSAASAADMMSQALPAPIEPLDPSLVATLTETATRVAEKLGGGQTQIPPIEPTEDGSLPPQLTPLLGVFQAFAPMVGMDDFDVEKLVVDNRGLQELAARIDQMGQDPAAMKAAQSPPEAAPAAPAPSAPPERDLDAMLGAP